jgi:hypothetical protein
MTDAQTLAPPPGWYTDPAEPGRQRWWSGAEWTEHVQAPPPAFAAQPYSIAAVDGRDAAPAGMLQPAITSLAFGIGSLLLNPLFLASIVAWARGGQALRRARRRELDGYTPHGRTLALWGVWLGVAGVGNGILLTLLVVVPWVEYLF